MTTATPPVSVCHNNIGLILQLADITSPNYAELDAKKFDQDFLCFSGFHPHKERFVEIFKDYASISFSEFLILFKAERFEYISDEKIHEVFYGVNAIGIRVLFQDKTDETFGAIALTSLHVANQVELESAPKEGDFPVSFLNFLDLTKRIKEFEYKFDFASCTYDLCLKGLSEFRKFDQEKVESYKAFDTKELVEEKKRGFFKRFTKKGSTEAPKSESTSRSDAIRKIRDLNVGRYIIIGFKFYHSETRRVLDYNKTILVDSWEQLPPIREDLTLTRYPGAQKTMPPILVNDQLSIEDVPFVPRST